MAGNDKFFEALKELDGVWESPGRNLNHANDDDDWHSTPETRDHEIQMNSPIDFDGNFPASNFSRETRVALNRSTEFSIQGFDSYFDISTSDSLAGAEQSSFEATEENQANSFLPPFQIARGDFGRTDENQSNPSELSSNQQNITRNNQSPVQKKRPRNASFRGEESTFREKGNNPAEFSLLKKPNPTVLAWPLQMSVDGNEATARMDYLEWSTAYATISQIDNISSLGKATDRVSPGFVAGAEAVPIAGSSGIQTQGHRIGKEKLFKCGVCQKTFDRKGNLDDHSRTHTGDKPFECKTCGKRFAKKVNLTRHLRIHTGEKPFVCEFCGNRFARKHHLEIHLWTHTGEKPFKCEFCDECFAQKSHCNRHQRRKHGGM